MTTTPTTAPTDVTTALPPRQADHPLAEMFLARWSPRAFTDEDLPDAALLSILEAARWAPSGGNGQPWRFVAARRGTGDWQAICAALAPGNQVWAAQAPVLVVLASQSHRLASDGSLKASASHAFDAGAAWAYLALQAHLLGFKAHAMGGWDGAALAQAVALPAHHALHAVVAIGRQGPADLLPEDLAARESPSLRKPLAETLVIGRFRAED